MQTPSESPGRSEPLWELSALTGPSPTPQERQRMSDRLEDTSLRLKDEKGRASPRRAASSRHSSWRHCAPPRRPCVESGETPRPGLSPGARHRGNRLFGSGCGLSGDRHQ